MKHNGHSVPTMTDVPEYKDTIPSAMWNRKYKEWLQRRGFHDELARIEFFAKRGQRRGGAK